DLGSSIADGAAPWMTAFELAELGGVASGILLGFFFDSEKLTHIPSTSSRVTEDAGVGNGVSRGSGSKKKGKNPTMAVCRYGSACNRKDCIYRHPQPRADMNAAPVDDADGSVENKVCMPFVAG
ncbi:hypothetical protein FOZ62_014057, partial [Perkinsus olseni]